MNNFDIHYTVSVDAQDEGLRLDKFLSLNCEGITRNRIQQLLKDGCVTKSGGVSSSGSYKVKYGDVFVISVPEVIDADPEPQDIPLDIVYEDNDVIVVNKGAGMVVHPAAGNYDGTLVNALLHHAGDSLSGINGVKRPGIVHRLDKGTSGLMVVAKGDKAHNSLAKQLHDRTMSRTYVAVVWGVPNPLSGTVTGAIARSSQNRKKMAIVKSGGKEAITHYKVLETFGRIASLVECKLETGRTHQIRVHMTSLGHSLVGDPLYGRNPKSVPKAVLEFINSDQWGSHRVALHAKAQRFVHPSSGEDMFFEKIPPCDILALVDVLSSAI